MSNKPNNYQHLFIQLALKRLPHHLALSLATNMHFVPLVAALDRYAKKNFIKKIGLLPISKDEMHNYSQTTAGTVLWHGTGRYQHSGDGDIDVLESVLKRGSLRPVEDAYAIFSGGNIMHSISLTRLRVIARCYADTNGKGFREPNRYGDALMWISYYYGLFYAHLYTRDYFSVRKYYRTWHGLTHDENGHNTWGKKTNKSAKDVWDIFGLGTDIDNNYPIIFGVKYIDDRVALSPRFNKYEVRTSSDIRLSQITHIEVPKAHVTNVETLLRRHKAAIPVLSIEAGEHKASHTEFSQLLGYSIKKEAQ